MSKMQENHAAERDGELQVASVENIENLQSDMEKQNEEVEPDSTYHAENSELDAFLSEATATKEEVYQEGVQARKAEKLKMTPEEATQYAVMGITEIAEFAKQQSGKDLQIGGKQMVVTATLLMPAIMKYGPVVQNYLSDMAGGVDEDSYMPEYLAAGGVAALLSTFWWQSRKIDKAQAVEKAEQKKQGAKDGNQS